MKNKTIKGNIVDLFSKEIFCGSLEIGRGKIKKITKTPGREGPYILPGWTDAHVHVESSMLTPGNFARACIPHGTLAVVADPHEIANVIGTGGVDYMIQEGKKVPLRFCFGAPSCVPATDFETAGAAINAEQIEKLLDKKEIKYLAEMMNFPGVLGKDPEVMKKIAAARKRGKPVDGHAPGLTGFGLEQYVNAGIVTDHESCTIDEARDKIRLGMKILVREGSAARNFDELIPLIAETPEMVMFCSDDLHPDDLVKGHINLLVKRAIQKGYDLFDILRAASLNPALHYGLDTGMLQPGDRADFIVVDNLKEMNVMEAYINGECVYREGKINFPPAAPPEAVNRFSAEKIKTEDLEVRAEGREVNVIHATDGELYTGKKRGSPALENGCLVSDPAKDLLKLCVINRYEPGRLAVGFISGLGLKKGAFGCSIAHDSHNIVVAGVSDRDLVEVANSIIGAKGGIAVCHEGKTSLMELPVAGLMSMHPAEQVAEEYLEMNKTIREMGSPLRAPVMTLSFMSLLVIPELKLGDRGLFDVNAFRFVSLFTGVE